MLVITALEIACCVLIAVGVSLVLGLGAGLIVLGALGVLACEWAGAKREAAKQRKKGRT